MKILLKRLLDKMPRFIYKSFYYVYNYFFYPETIEKKMKYGEKNKDKKFYVIRPYTNEIEGLMSLLMRVMKHIHYANKKGYIPIIDFENYKTQYYDDSMEILNVWEYYFQQPSDYKLSEVYESANVWLSGQKGLEESKELNGEFAREVFSLAHDIVVKQVIIKNEVYELVNEEKASIDVSKTLGLYLRGTDYAELKPSGHRVQPTVEEAIGKADEILERQNLEYIFLVTEDAKIYHKVKEHYKDKLRIVSYDSFIEGYDGKGYLSKDRKCMQQLADSAYQRGLNYLGKIIILSQCNSLVGGGTSGSWIACALTEGYREQYIFELGRY